MIDQSSNKHTRLAFGELLIKQLKLSAKLLTCLTKEYGALKTRELDQLQKLSEVKQGYLVQLEQLTQSSYEILEKNSYPVNRTGAEAFVKECETHGMQGMAKQWGNLESVLEKCQKKNQMNGNIIQMSRKNIHHALNIIYNESTESASYGPAGKCVPKHVKRTMDVA